MTFKSGAMIAATVATMLTGFAGCGDEKTTTTTQGHHHRDAGRLRRGPRGRQARGRNDHVAWTTSCLGRWRGDTASAFAFRTTRRS